MDIYIYIRIIYKYILYYIYTYIHLFIWVITIWPVSHDQRWFIVSTMTQMGGFHKWRIPNSWLVYNGKTENKIDNLRVPPFQGTSIWAIIYYSLYMGNYIYMIFVNRISFGEWSIYMAILWLIDMSNYQFWWNVTNWEW